MSSSLDKFERLVNSLSNWLNWIAGAALVAMLALIVADIIGAKLFKWPIPGGIEMVGFLAVVVIAFAIAETQVLRGHIEVEFLVMRLPQTAQKVISALVYVLGMALFALLAWRSCDFAHTLQVKGEVSMTERIPFYPFVYGIAFCCISVFLILLGQFLRGVTKAMR
ncbi:MAG: TRAP transporter small permease [Dehalococcoidia bacterium]|nr:TRAP transporter small permease [Dehalococcoidia bacterium]